MELNIFTTSDPTTPGYYTASQTALLLLDFHTRFVQRASGAKGPAALKIATKMRTWAKSHGIRVIHCVIDLTKQPFPTCKGAARLSESIVAMRENGSEEPDELVQDYGDDVTFTRRLGHVSALKSPGLEEYLQGKGIKSLILTGLSTSGCVLKTAVAATDAEYVVTVVSDGCADSKQEVHDVVLRDIVNRGYVATAAEVCEGFGKG